MEWATPREFFRKLDSQFNFTLDPCARATMQCVQNTSHQMKMVLSKIGQGTLCLLIRHMAEELVAMVKKSYEESLQGRHHGCHAHSCTYRYKVLARICNEGRRRLGSSKVASSSVEEATPPPSRLQWLSFNSGAGDPVENPPKLAVM
jgi:hypothetical protein